MQQSKGTQGREVVVRQLKQNESKTSEQSQAYCTKSMLRVKADKRTHGVGS